MRNRPVRLKALDAEVCEALSDPEMFADLFNGSIFEGKQVVNPDSLRPCSEMQTLQVGTGKNDPETIKRIRDVKMEGHFLEGQPAVLLAVEAQREVHYGMPVRGMMYDGMDYSVQIKKIKKYNKQSNNLKSSSEYISGLSEADHLIPVLTIVFYYGEGRIWDKPTSLHDMLKFPDVLLPWKQRFSDYSLNLVSSANVNYGNFRTGLREVFELLGVAHDKESLEKLLTEKKEYYSSLPKERSKLIAVFLEIPMLKESPELFMGQGGGINMCTAINEMVRDGEMRGEIRGEERGIIEGKEIGERDGEKKYNELLKILLKEKCMEEIHRMTVDEDYRKQLYLIYNI